MHRIQTNNQKNWLYFRLSGNVDYRESKNVLDSIIKSLEDLKPGFDIISDISAYTPLSITADTNISSLLRTLKEHGVRKTIRIDSNPSSYTSYASALLINGIGFQHCETVESLEEAEKLLEN
nr:hypothetical protein [uncultured Sphaerochaeta sp.]